LGRIYESVEVNGKRLNTLFDSGAVRSYITRKSAEETGLKIEKLKTAFKTALGKTHIISEYCVVQGNIKGNPFYITSNVIEELGMDEKGEEIRLLFGANDMQIWNINLDLKRETLDLSRFRKEFIEYNSVNYGKEGGEVFNGTKPLLNRWTIA
jgi:hypothetical protein